MLYIFVYTAYSTEEFDKNGMKIYKSIQNTCTLFDIKVTLTNTKSCLILLYSYTSSLKNFKSIAILSLSSSTVIIFEWTRTIFYFRILLCPILIIIIKIDSGDWGDLSQYDYFKWQIKEHFYLHSYCKLVIIIYNRNHF